MDDEILKQIETEKEEVYRKLLMTLCKDGDFIMLAECMNDNGVSYEQIVSSLLTYSERRTHIETGGNKRAAKKEKDTEVASGKGNDKYLS